MDVEIHPNAKKHLTEKQVLSAWLAVGWLPDGRSVELVAVELVRGGLSFMPCLQSRRNFGRRLNGLGKGVDDGQDVYGR